MLYNTYILKSKVADKTYVGHTSNLEKRLVEHNGGTTSFSKRYKPWKIIYSEKFTDEETSVKREKYFKSASGRRWIMKNLF